MASSNTNDVQTKILEIEIRYETAIQQLGKYRDEIEKTKQVMKDLKTAHSNGVMSTAEFQQSMSACEQQIKANQSACSVLTRQIQSQIKVEKEQEGSLNELRTLLSKATAEYDAMNRAERESAKGKELKEKINSITLELKGAEQETDRFYRNVGNYQEAVNGLDKVEQKVKGVGKAFLGLAGITSLGALGKQAEEVGSKYADQMAKVQAVTNANTVEFAQMSAEVERLGSTTRYTAQEASEAMEFLTRNGLDTVSATNSLTGVLKLAQANAIELGESADIVTGQMNAFHLKVEDVTRINDVLSFTCSHSATNILQLNEALRNTAPIAYTAGVSIEETAAALGTLANNNIKGADSGTILKQTFNGLITSTQKSKKAYSELGIEMNIATVQNDGLVASLKKIMNAGASVEQLSDIFGRRAVPGVLALINSIDQLSGLYDDIAEKNAGTTARMFEQSYSNYSVAMASLKSAWEGLLIRVWGGTNETLRRKFVEEADALDKEWGDRIAAIEERIKSSQSKLAVNPASESAKEAVEQANAELTEARTLYANAKDTLADQMQRESIGNKEVARQWNEAAESLKNEYVPQIEMLEERYQKALQQSSNDPENEAAVKELFKVKEELKQTSDIYEEAKMRLSDQMRAEATGNDKLVGQLRYAASAVDETREKMIGLKTEMESMKAAVESNPESSELYSAYEGKRKEYQEAQKLYRESAEQYAEVQSEVNMSLGSGLSGMTTDGLTILKDIVAWVKENINELATMIMAIIAGISLTKLVNHVKTSSVQMKTDLITNANAASQNVQNLITKETLLRNQQRRQETQLAQASGQERVLIEQKLAITKELLRINDLAKEKAKLAEQKAVQQAAAMSTATGWKAAMTSASLAVKGFVTASKTALKSFALTAILSLAIELVMKLWNALDSGEGTIGKIGSSIKSFIQDALNKLGAIMTAVINYFVELYNDSIIVRGAIALLGGVFNSVWAILKAGIEAIGNNFKLLGNIIGGVATALQGLLTTNWDKAKEGISQLGKAVTDFYKGQKEVAVNAGKEIADGFVKSFNDIDKKIDKVEWTSPNGSSVSNSKSSASSSSTSSANQESNDETESTGGGNGKDSKTSAKEESERRKREKIEMEALANLQNELYKIEADGAEKRRKEVEAQYDKRIDKLKTQLATEKNLTSTARKAINDLIVVIEKEKDDAFVKLSAEERKREIEEEIKNNEARLNLIRKGTGAELSEKLRGLAEERDVKIKKAQEEISDENERQLQIYLINADFEQMRLDLISGSLDTELGLRLANLDNKHEIAVREAQDAIAVEEGKIAKLRELSKEEYDSMSDQEKESYDRQLQEATEALSRKQETLTLINEQYTRDTTAAQEESEAQAVERQKQALEDRILVMQNDEEQRLQLLRNGRQMSEEEELADQQRKLESIGGFEAQKLEVEAEYAQQAYDDLMARGQLSTQTEEEFNCEVEQARQNNLNAKKAIDDAYVKQEKAKYDSMKALTSSLTGLLDTLGEDNKAFAAMSKVITLAQIAIDTGRAISAGVASASSMPFPANLAAIATTVATVIANVTTAISTVKSAKFAEGGRVSGPGTGTSDSVPAMLSNGEFVMTAAATKIYEPLLVTMNNIGKGVPMQVVSSNRDAYMSESLTESFSAAVQDIQPVVSVTEINEVQTRVRTIENLDNF